MFTITNLWVIIGLAVFAGLLGLLAAVRGKLGFTARVGLALVLGAIFGVVMQIIFGAETQAGAGALIKKWINIVGSLFTKSLQLIIVPLVLVSIINAITKLTSSGEGFKKAGRIIAFLLVTTAISAVFTLVFVRIFNLSADHLIEYTESASRPADVAGTILNLIPNNIFGAFASNSVLPVVFAAALIGFAYLAVKKDEPGLGARFEAFLETAYALVLKMVHFVIGFTPYGVLAIITVRVASGNGMFIIQLGLVIAVSFAAMLAIFIMHLVIATAGGIPPLVYLKKTGPALLFAFSSRSSAATVPLTIEAQRSLGVGEANANLAAALGTCIGQNGCAGLTPPMIAILVGLVQGWNVWSPAFLVPLVLYVVIASIGTAGVGGGAINVSLLVMSLMGLPVELVAVLISIDFIIDMGRTLINVSDSILAGFVAGRLEREINEDALYDRASLETLEKQELRTGHSGAAV
ncbi:MAG: cation:dicarboxylase symporter family transporter [Spirochaetaceae bacterium]|jgi:L-cystine uptake protein TcyP (sodium:dicarboxylate symporter family)|nr:cation:dicarboxylase symporter family transporter [Spirochaetaceae bacterium]